MLKLDLKIPQGKTFERVVRWEAEPFIYKAITAISKTAPARITATAHGIYEGWRVAVVSVLGMRQINAVNDPPKEKDFVRATVIDANIIDLNAVNAAGFSTYISGGYLQFYTAKSLAGCLARMTIRDRIGGTALLSLDSALLGGIALDDTLKTITVTVTAAQTAAFTWTHAVYDLEIRDAASKVHGLYYGAITITPKEVTT